MSDRPPETSSTLKILAIIGLVFLLGVIVLVGTCAYCVLSNPAVRKTGSLIGETMRMGLEATKAPGTAELRAAGCPEAMVMDLRRMVALVKELEADGGQAKVQLPEEEWQKTLVVCQYPQAGETLGCDVVARTFGAAVPSPPSEFGVVVRVNAPPAEVCRGVYGPDGTLLQEIAEPVEQGGPFLAPPPGRLPAEAPLEEDGDEAAGAP